MNIVFFGTDELAKAVLKFLLGKRSDVVAVVTTKDQPKGRSQQVQSPPVKNYLEEISWKGRIFQPDKASNAEFIEDLVALKPDLFIVVSYGKILRQSLLDLPKYGSINVHPSLLPKYRGPSPFQSAVLAGEKEVGVTLMKMVLAMDAGEIIQKIKISLPLEMSYGELETVLADLSKEPLLKVVEEIERKGRIDSFPQNESEATYTKKIVPEDGYIHWDRPVQEIHNLIRGMNPKPGARCFIEINGKKLLLKILRTKIEGEPFKSPGETILYDKKNGWQISCLDGVLSILELQLEGKKKMTITEFINGFNEPKICN